MSALSDMLRTKSTPIKECIVFTAAHGHPTLGEDAAAELAAMQAHIVDERTQAYKDLLLEIDRSVYPEVYGYIEDKILALKGE